MKVGKKHISVLQRNGTSQSQRFPESLDPEQLKIDGRTEADLIDYALEFAEQLNFYTLDNLANGDWRPFFEQLKAAPLETLDGQLSPQAGLFLAFLRLFKKQQDQLNGLTKKHLDLFFRDILKIKPKQAVGDQVHLLFELSGKLPPAKIAKGSLFKAGKDSDGLELSYQLNEDIIVNHAIVESIRSVLVDTTSNQLVHKGEAANTADGVEAKLPEENPKWPAFGKRNFAPADLGFAFASPVLWLQEGTRKIVVTLFLRGDESLEIPDDALNNSLKVWLSGEEEWLGPYFATPSQKEVSGRYQLRFELQLPETEKPVSFFNSSVLTGDFQTVFPVMKVVPDTASFSYLNAFLQGAVLEDVRIEVDVKGIENFDLKNDQGKLDASKAFFPFGAEPVRGASFEVGCEEAFTKKLNSFSLEVDWLDVPSTNMRTHYGSSYGGNQAGLNYYISSNQFKALLSYRNKRDQPTRKTVDLFYSSNNQSQVTYDVDNTAFIGKIVPLMPAVLLAGMTENRMLGLAQQKYRLLPGNKRLGRKSIIRDLRVEAPDKGYVSLELLDDFFHRQYRQKYVKATVEHQSGGDLFLPKEPYSPKIKKLRLSYKAVASQANLKEDSESAFLQRDIEFFQLGAFGQREVHAYLQRQAAWTTNDETTLLADYSQQGELLVGVKNWAAGQTLQLLIQVAEGSANPEKDKEPVQWSLLMSDAWRPLTTEYLLADGTNGLLRSGIVKVNLPEGKVTESGWMPAGLVWLRASVQANPDAVCQLIGVHAQAGIASVVSPQKHPAHLKQPLAAETISKLQRPNPAIKKVLQPYASFGGRAVEADTAYYTRVSERLRHKNRAINQWDYERLVLQEFPGLSQVKCLNHSCPSKNLAPGHVHLIVVPNLQNKNAVNRLQPRVSKDLLDQIRRFVGRLSSIFVELHVSNPFYEEVQLEFGVSFLRDYEFGYYQKELNRELVEFLSPWSIGKQTEFSFGGRIEKSVLLKFVETRHYVDFVSHFNMYHEGGTDQESAIASSPKAILVSHREHLIHRYTRNN
ncbi:baseplate J/gp47 family protein [Sunxiuqinia elliptica]